MIPTNNWLKLIHWVALIVVVVAITNLAIFLNIPFLRQIFGFFFLTMLPGLLILQILKLNKMDSTEKFVLSVGLSISFLMFFGLLINNLLFGLGYLTPLSTISLSIAFNIAIITLAIIGYKLNKNSFFPLPNLNLTMKEKVFLIVPVLFPALSIFGMHVMNTTGNNLILMLLLFLIPIYVIFVCFFNHKFPTKLYPAVIFLISISLILLMPLRSNHLIGSDVHAEYYYFRTTMDNFHWSAFGHSTLDACLAISLLPTIYQSILNIPSEILYKILPSLLYSVSPLVIYVISKKYVENEYAFLAACFFISQTVFLWTEYNARSNISALFFALAMMTLFSDKIDPLRKKILFIVFMASSMVSHYSNTYVFFFLMVGTFIGIEVFSRKYTFKKMISLTLVILFFAMIFFWYSQVTETAFNAGVGFIEKTFKNLHEFFIVESRGTGQALLGKDIMQKGIPHKIEFMFTWLTLAFIGIGVITLIRRYKEMSFPELGFKKSDFLKKKFEVGYFVLVLACSGLLATVLGVPYIAAHYSLARMYPLALTILSVFFVIGGITLSKHFLPKERACTKKERKSFSKTFLSKKRFVLKETFTTQWDTHENENVFSQQKPKSSTKNTSQVRVYLIILLVLIPYFLCVTDVTYQMFGYSHELILSSEGEQYDFMYVCDQDSYGAKWIGNYNERDQKIYTDMDGRRLESQGEVPSSLIDYWSLFTYPESIDGYIYLRRQNVMSGKLLSFYAKKKSYYNLTDYQELFDKKNKIYDSGCSIYL